MLKLPAFVRWTSRRTSARSVDDSLEAFASERSLRTVPSRPERLECVGRRSVAAGVLAFSLLPVLVLGSYGLGWVRLAPYATSPSGSLSIESATAGAEAHLAGSRTGTAAPAPPGVPVRTSGSAAGRARRVANVPTGRRMPVAIEVSPARLDLSDLPGVDAWREAEPVGPAEIGSIGVAMRTTDLVLPVEKIRNPPPVKAAYAAPVAVQEELPPWTPPTGLAARVEYVGVFRVRIGVDGRVTGSEVLESSHPVYDAQLSRAASDWLYRPATRDGRPVPSLKDIRIRLVPR